MILFSPSQQSFYDTELVYSFLPDDIIEIDSEQHLKLLTMINSGCRVLPDLTCSEPKPSLYYIWGLNGWEDPRTSEQKRADYLLTLHPLTRRQFKLTLLDNNLLETVEQRIDAIEDPTMRTRIQIEYNESVNFERSSESVAFMSSLLELTSEQVDAMWEHALTL